MLVTQNSYERRDTTKNYDCLHGKFNIISHRRQLRGRVNGGQCSPEKNLKGQCPL